MLDVIVIGGGPAGAQAALTLARGQCRVALVDAGAPRNATASHVHNFVTRDGTPPARFRAIAREELERYGVELHPGRATAVDGDVGDFVVRLDHGALHGRRILLTVGVIDVLPPLHGVDALWGRTAFQCPYCHGHELRDQRWAVYLGRAGPFEPAIVARAWTDDVVALTDGHPVDDQVRARLAAAGVGVDTRRVTALEAVGPGRLGAVRFAEGRPLARDALVLRPDQRQVDLVRALGLALDAQGYVVVDGDGLTSRAGIYAAGDVTTAKQSALGAACHGLKVAGRINFALTAERVGWRG